MNIPVVRYRRGACESEPSAPGRRAGLRPPCRRPGHQVVLSNSRGPASLAGLADELGPLAHAGTPEEAAAAELVVLAVGWPQIPDALAGLPHFDGRIVIDATNQFASPPAPRSPTSAS